MILEVYSPPANDRQIVADTANESAIVSTIRNQRWKDLTFVVLRIDDKNWFEVSGSLNPEDGLAARYSENGTEYVSDVAPDSLEQCISLMLSYFKADDKWRSDIRWH